MNPIFGRYKATSLPLQFCLSLSCRRPLEIEINYAPNPPFATLDSQPPLLRKSCQPPLPGPLRILFSKKKAQFLKLVGRDLFVAYGCFLIRFTVGVISILLIPDCYYIEEGTENEVA